jgi:hypothetical protein
MCVGKFIKIQNTCESLVWYMENAQRKIKMDARIKMLLTREIDFAFATVHQPREEAYKVFWGCCTNVQNRPVIAVEQGFTKRCRLSWLTNSALVHECKCGGRRGVAGSQPMSTAVPGAQMEGGGEELRGLSQ